MTDNVKSYLQMRKEFYEKYTSIIIPTVKKYENVRKNKLYKAITISGCMSLLAVFILCLPIFGIKIYDIRIPILLFVGSFLSWNYIKKTFEYR